MDEIRADYEQLEQIANRFATQAQVIQTLLQRVRASKETLVNEGWKGLGVNAFSAEMNDEVLPATMRLLQALDEASMATRDTIRTMQSAEEEASALFHTSS
jgi:WXG100 family type VII secretion target